MRCPIEVPPGSEEAVSFAKRVKSAFNGHTILQSSWGRRVVPHVKTLSMRCRLLAPTEDATVSRVLEVMQSIVEGHVEKALRTAEEELDNVGSMLHRVAKMFQPIQLQVVQRFDSWLQKEGYSKIPMPKNNQEAGGSRAGRYGTRFLNYGVFDLSMWSSPDAHIFMGTATFLRPSEGAPGWAHGGVISAVSDAFLAWVSMFVNQGAGTTTSLKITFRSPVPVLAIAFLCIDVRSSEAGHLKGTAVDACNVLLFEFEGDFINIRKKSRL